MIDKNVNVTIIVITFHVNDKLINIVRVFVIEIKIIDVFD